MSICKHQFKSGRCVHCGSLAVGIINALKQQLKGSEARCKSRDKVIYSLEQQLTMLREAVDLYMDEAWHHEDCPSYRGDTFEHCTCGYTALKEQDNG